MNTFYDTFKIQRLKRLMTNDIRLQSKPMMTIAITALLVMILLPLPATGNTFVYHLLLFFGGLVITSMAFKDLHNPNKTGFYLTLPCSNVERLLSRWLLTSVGFAIATLSCYCLFSIIAAALHLSFTSHIVNIWQPYLWHGIRLYLIIQPLFLYGAIKFKRYAFFKTILMIVAFQIIMVFSGFVFLQFILPNFVQSGLFKHIVITINPETFSTLAQATYAGIWLLLPVLFVYLTYLKLKKYELK
jgi:hypothetical protein